MAMKEIEDMYTRIEELIKEKERAGESPEKIQRVRKYSMLIDDVTKTLINGFDTSVKAGRLQAQIVRQNLNGEISMEEFEKKQSEIFMMMNSAAQQKTYALANLDLYSKRLGVRNPVESAKDENAFVRQLVGEYDAYGQAYDRAYEHSLNTGEPFAISEQAPRSQEIVQLANAVVDRARESMAQGVLPKDAFSSINDYRYLSTAEFKVVKHLGVISSQEPRENVKGVVEVLRSDNGKKDKAFVPAVYLPEKGYYIVTKKDFDEKVKSVGRPVKVKELAQGYKGREMAELAEMGKR